MSLVLHLNLSSGDDYVLVLVDKIRQFETYATTADSVEI